MLIKCAWCKTQMGDVFPFSDKRTSCGICPSCKVIFDEEIAAYRQKRIDEQMEDAGG